MTKFSILGLGLGWVAMLIFCMRHDSIHIQNDLTAQSAQILANQNIATPNIADALKVDGREVTLTGYEGTPGVSDQTYKSVSAVWGVNSVTRNILKRPEPPKPVVTQAQAQEAAKTISTILKFQNVEFYTNSDKLTPRGETVVDQVSTVLAKYSGMSVEIQGHTDSVGNPEANLDLSKRRAATVKQYLIGKGITAANLVDSGFGQTKPIASNQTAAGRQQNRRVEFHTKETN